jgi:hypothetical protein
MSAWPRHCDAHWSLPSPAKDQRLREIIHEIQQAAIISRSEPPSEDDFFELMGPPVIFASFSRGFWQPDATGSLTDEFSFASDSILDWSIVNRFKNLADLNLKRLREKIRDCLATSDSILLSEILRRFQASSTRETVLTAPVSLCPQTVRRCRS